MLSAETCPTELPCEAPPTAFPFIPPGPRMGGEGRPAQRGRRWGWIPHPSWASVLETRRLKPLDPAQRLLSAANRVTSALLIV